MPEWEAALTDRCCRSSFIIHILLLIMMSVSEVTGERDAGSGQTKKAACALCTSFVEILSTWLKLNILGVNAECRTWTSCGLWWVAGMLDATRYATYYRSTYVYVRCTVAWSARWAMTTVAVRRLERRLELGCFFSRSTGLVPVPVWGAIGPVDRTRSKIEPGPQPYWNIIALFWHQRSSSGWWASACALTWAIVISPYWVSRLISLGP